MTRRGRAVAVAVVLVAVAGCGVPGGGGEPRTVPGEEVPYGLLAPPSSEEPTETPEGPGTTSPVLYLTDADDQLVPSPVTVEATGVQPVVVALLDRLSQGPTEAQRDLGLSSALATGVELTLDDIVGTTARVEVSAPDREPTADRLPLAVGQVVLTLTSVEGVDDVLLVQDGEPTEMALPGGARTSSPVSPAQYRSLLSPDEPPVPRVEPTPTSP